MADVKKNTPTLEQWAELYQVASIIQNMKPWHYLWDTDLITILLPHSQEPIYISVMGRNGACYGIGVYPGYKSIAAFYRLLHMPENELPAAMMNIQNCLMCYYGNRDELSPNERAIIKALGLKCRGENNWIYFRSMKEGYYPWFLNSEQVVLMTQALQNFVMAFKYILNGKITVRFEENETLLRLYSEERKEWLNTVIPVTPIPVDSSRYVIDNKDLLHKLNCQKPSNMSIEFDLVYLSIPFQDNKDETPYFPGFLSIVERNSGMCLSQHIADKDEETEITMINMLCDFMFKNGKPNAIYIRDDRFLLYIADLCKKINVKIIYGKGMPGTNELVMETTKLMRNR